jgi:DNA-binding beta-propeller fold protein YncE
MSEEQRSIEPGGGAHIRGDVHVQDGDFVGRDKIVSTINNFVQQAVSAVEEAEKARAFAQQRLAEGVRDYAQRLAEVAADDTDAVAGGPYRGLLAYGLGDAELFFGRDRAIGELLEHMQRGRLTVLQAESGAGKSSLLQAGISPRLLAAGHLPVNLRAYDLSPSLKIKQTFLPNLAQIPDLAEAPLREFLRQVTGVLGRGTTLYLLLDQFEEFFTLLLDEAQRTAFVDELASCLEDESLNVRWVLAVRSEFFGDLAAFRPRIRNPFQHDYRLNRLTRAEAEIAITEPAARHGIEYDPALVEQLLTDLAGDGGEIAPPQVQLVCLALYQTFMERRAEDPDLAPIISQEMYREEGGAQGILRGHLNRVLRRMLQTRSQRELARHLLVALVSSDQRRIRRTRSDLANTLAAGILAAQSLDQILTQLDPVLGQMIESRLLNVEGDEETDEASYELAHDYLLGEITLDPQVQAQKAAQEMLDQEVATWQSNDKLRIPEDRLDIIEAQEANLVWTEDARTLLRLSRETLRRRRRFMLAGTGVVVVLMVLAVASVVLAVGANRLANQAQDDLGTATAAIATATVGLGYAQQRQFEADSMAERARGDLGTATAAIATVALELDDAQQRRAEAERAAATATVRLAEAVAAQETASAAADAAATREAAADRAAQTLYDRTGVVAVEGAPNSIAFDGARLWMAVVSDEDGAIQAVDPATGRAEPPIPIGSSPRGLIFDGRWLWVALKGDGAVQAIDPASGGGLEPVAVGTAPQALVFDGTRVWVATGDGVQAIDPASQAAGDLIPVGATNPVLASDGRWLWATGSGEGISKIDPTTGAVEATFPVVSDDLLPASGWLWASDWAGGVIRALDPATGAIERTFAVDGSPTALGFDGTRLWVATSNDTVQALDPVSGASGAPLQVGGSPFAMTFDGTRMWVANSADRTVQAIRDLAQGDAGEPIQVGANPDALAFDGERVWVLTRFDNGVYIIDPDTRAVVMPAARIEAARMLAFDGTRMWVTGRGGVYAVDPESAQVENLVSLDDGGNTLAFDGTHMWVVSGEGLLLVHVGTGEIDGLLPVGTSTGPLAFDGTRMWVAGTGGVRAIDPATREVGPPVLPPASRQFLFFDGTHLWATGQGTIQTIDPASGEVGAPILIDSRGYCFGAMAFDGTRLWIGTSLASTYDCGVQAIDPQSGEVSEPTPIQARPSALVFDGRWVWVANGERDGDRVQAIDPSSGQIVLSVPVGDDLADLVFDGVRLWVANTRNNTVQHIVVHK